MLALAYPDRIAKSRGGGSGRFLLANGRGGNVDPASALAREPFLAVAELTGSAAASRIILAAPIALAEIEARFADKIEEREAVDLRCRLRVAARAAQPPARRAGAGRTDQGRSTPDDDNAHNCWPKASPTLGIGKLPWSKAQLQLRNRVLFLRRAEGEEWPDLSDDCAGAQRGRMAGAVSRRQDRARRRSAPTICRAALDALLPWTLRKRLDAEAPTHFTAPSGSSVPIDYEAEQGPTVSIRVQELFGLAQHPAIAGGRVPLVIELLSPAHRPVQVTRDLPGFWRGSYADVKTEMRGRYPRHPWPDDPLSAPATRRAKRRGE